MALSLAATGYFIYLVEPWTPDAVVASVIIFNAAFGYRYDLDVYLLSTDCLMSALCYSWGPLPWLYPPEVSYIWVVYITCREIIFSLQIMPLTFRAKGVSLSTATNWAFNWVVGQMTPWLQDLIEWRLYFMHSFFCVCSFFLG